MSDIYQITLTTQTGETFTGKMSRRQPELVNGFVPLATETGVAVFRSCRCEARGVHASSYRGRNQWRCRLSVEIKSRWWVPVYLRTLTVFCLDDALRA
jgi:hypothetical protein